MIDGDSPSFKIHGAPANAQHLAAAEAVVGGKLDDHGHGVILGGFKQSGQLLLGVERCQVFSLLGAVHLIRSILADQFVFYGVLQGFADYRVVVDDRIRITAVLKNGLVQIPDMARLDVAQPQTAFPKERVQPGVDHVFVAPVRRALNSRSGDLQPIPQEIGKQWRLRFRLLQDGFRFPVLLLQLFQAGLGFPLVTLHWDAQGDRFLLSFSGFVVKIQDSRVFSASFYETAGNFSMLHKIPPSGVHSRLCDVTLDERIFQVFSSPHR